MYSIDCNEAISTGVTLLLEHDVTGAHSVRHRIEYVLYVVLYVVFMYQCVCLHDTNIIVI